MENNVTIVRYRITNRLGYYDALYRNIIDYHLCGCALFYNIIINSSLINTIFQQNIMYRYDIIYII